MQIELWDILTEDNVPFLEGFKGSSVWGDAPPLVSFLERQLRVESVIRRLDRRPPGRLVKPMVFDTFRR